ncbi:alpha-crystallin B chain-like [Centruroides sculpturatus]|uniref:alpha-crystallin B chain-like n=1 Tax=Centruroides sculpturatus TaxID=218467 RepID=UPI000C6D46DE|nr:alpha-crystallin B chain-like [Centruroides sculpturatus]
MSPLVRLVPSLNSKLLGIRHFWRSRDPFHDFESGMRYLERQMRDMEREMRRLYDNFNARDVFLSLTSPWFGRQVPIESSNAKEKFTLKLDVIGYKPEDIKVTVRNHILTIQARKQETTKDGAKVYREYTHQYNLPEEVDPDTVRSMCNSDGNLIIEAPLKFVDEPKTTEIPVENIKDEK